MTNHLKLVCMVIFCMAIIGAPLSTNAMLCGQFSDHFSSCVDFGRGFTEVDTLWPCCAGMRAITGADTSVEAQKASCRCMVGALNVAMVLPNFPLEPSRLGSIRPYCRIALPYQISPSTNCDNIHTSVDHQEVYVK